MKKFEDCIGEIDVILSKNRPRWQLNCIAHMDYSDVCQIIRTHIYKKWEQWDQVRPLAPWVNKIINSQIKNQIRNNYGKFAPPCNGCPNNKEGDLCGGTESGYKCSECPLYAKWEKSKKRAYNLNLPSSIDSVGFIEIGSLDSNIGPDCPNSIHSFHSHMLKTLPERLHEYYRMAFVDLVPEKELVVRLGLSIAADGRCKQLSNLRRSCLEHAKKELPEIEF